MACMDDTSTVAQSVRPESRGALACGLVRQPTAEPCQAAGTEAALRQVVHAACLLGLLADDNCVAPGVTSCPVVSLISTWRWGRLSRVVASRHGLLCGAIVVAAGGHWLTA